MLPDIAPHARLVVSRQLLIKSSEQFAHSGKHALYGNPPRWHLITPNKPAPKGAPIAHDPAAVPATPYQMPAEQVAQIKLPDTNTNAGTFNKQVDKVVGFASTGNATAILGMQIGVNTYGAKLAKIANFLLQNMGVHEHVVAHGQGAGMHAALQTPPAAPKTTADLQEPGPLAPLAQHVKDTLDEKAAEGNVEFLKMVAANNPEHPQIVAYAKEKLAGLGGKPATPPATPIATPTTPSLPPGAKLSTDVNAVPLAHTTTPEAAAAIQKDGFKPSGNSMYGKGVYFSSAAQSAAYGSTVLSAKLKPHKQLVLAKDSDVSKAFTALTGLSSGHLGSDKGAQAMIDAGVGSMVFPVDDETYTVVFDPGLIDVQADAAAGPLAMPAFEEGKTTTGVKAYYEKVAQKIIDHGHAGNASVLADMKADGLKPNAKGKTTNTWLGKTANSKKLLALHAAALEHATGGKPVSQPKPEPSVATPAPAAAPAVTPETGKLTAQQLSNLQSIPWFKLKLPPENTNAKSHNAALAKIEAMAFAGDTAGLQAFIDAKAGAKQTYAKKQVLTAQTALAGLQQPGATAAVPVAQQPEPAPANILTEDQEVGLLNWMAAGKPTSSKPGSWSTLWSTLPKDLKTDLASIHAATAGKVESAKHPSLVNQLASASGPEQKLAVQKQFLSTHGETERTFKQLSDAFEKDGDSATAQYWANKADEADNEGAPTATPPAAAKTVTAPKTILHNTTPGHSKSWSVYVAPNASGGFDMVTEYGKIGAKQQKTAKSFPTADAAHNAATALKQEKFGKGYVTQKVDYGHQVTVAGGADTGPKEGDTKQGADGMLVLKNGHWVKMDTAPAVVKKLKLIDISTAIQTVTPGQTKFSNNAAGKLATAAAKGGNAAGIVEAHAKALHYGWKKTAGHVAAVAHAMGVTIPAAGATTAAAATAPASPAATPGAHPSMDAWAQVGPQGGSNPGGKFKDPTGQEWYCKFPGDEATAKSEVLAAKLYGLAGLSGQDAILVSKGGKVGIATKWVDIKKAPSAAALAKVDGVHSGFAVDAWLGNWDVVGMSLDNLQIGPDGKAHRVDAGGSLEYRAQGAKKPFGTKVEEIDTLRDVVKNPHAAAVFAKMTKADIVASVAKVAAISDVTIRAMVNQYGPGTQEEKAKLAETLIARKADLLKRYPQAAKKKKAIVFDPSKVSAPPSFLNWGGSGKSGPSSKEFLNKANEEAAQAIYQAAKTGNLDAIKSLQANVYDKDTGAVVGSKPVLEHPSQHIKGYAQQVINEINYQMNPPKRFRFDGGHPLHSLNAAYPAHNGAGSSAAAQKLGKYIVLGTPGTVKLEDLALPPKVTHSSQGGSLTQQTYSPAAQAAIAKMPATQQQAVQSYTGSSYHAMNNSLWAGNPTGAAKSAGEALKTLGHDIAPGTVLSRKINLHGADLEAMLASSGKILQEPAIMSTSIRPSSWSGNVQLKLHVGPGVKGLWVGPGSKPGGGALSKHASEDEMILPPGTRMLIMSVKKGPDSDGFGQHGSHIIEAVILPT